MRILFPFALGLAAMLMNGCATSSSQSAPVTATPAKTQRCAFIGRTDLSDFTKTPGAVPGEFVLTSPEISAPNNWDELVASWNVPPGVYLKTEARAIFPDHTTKYYTLSIWSDDLARHARESINGQRDADGTVKIDTLVLKRHGGKVQVRLTMSSDKEAVAPVIKYFSLSFCDSLTQPPPREPNRAAWGRIVDAPQRRQGEYEGGGGWCSPTSTSMVLAYWSTNLNRPELNHTVPEVAHAIHDTGLDGTGNWPFNTAYAGSYPGIRAYVTRFEDISELEDWIAAGIAPIISVSSFINEQHVGKDNGHLIVCAGFTPEGDVVVNDPGVSVKKNLPARKVYSRQHVIDCWKKSKFAVYLIYPETATIPKNVSGHWDNGN